MQVLDWIKANWILVSSGGGALLTVVIFVLKFKAKQARIHAEAELERAKLTPDLKDDIDAREDVAEAKAVEEALNSVPVIGKD